jgi:septum formation protein
MLNAPLLLASASPRRADLLRAAGIPFDVDPADVDERVQPGEDAQSYIVRIARAKAATVAARAPTRMVLAADTIVLLDGVIFGKPDDEHDARRMLQALSGRRHEVLTAVSMVPGGRGVDRADEMTTRVARTTVEFAQLSAAEIAWYVGSQEPMGKAGGYAIQGLASRFIVRIEGSYPNVVGLPVALVVEMCREVGILVS